MRKWILRLLLLAALVGVGYVVKITLLAPEPVRVETAPVERGRVESTITNSEAGTIKARRRAKLSPGLSGVVVELGVERGEQVEAGALLLRLDDATQQAEKRLAERALEVAEATHRRACVAADRALRELERNRELVGSGTSFVSEDILDGLASARELALADCETAAAEVERGRASLGLAQAYLDKTELRAPFDAILAEVSVELGEWVTPSVPLLAAPDVIDAIDSTSLYISAPMDEVDAAKLFAGQVARVTIDPYPDRSFPGHIARVAPYVLDLERQNRTLEVEVELDDAEFSATLLPGTSADIEVILEVREDVLRVPTHALIEGGRVLVIDGDRLVEREVQTGLSNWDWTQLTGGLAEGERVVTNLDREGVRAGALVDREGDGVEP